MLIKLICNINITTIFYLKLLIRFTWVTNSDITFKTSVGMSNISRTAIEIYNSLREIAFFFLISFT